MRLTILVLSISLLLLARADARQEQTQQQTGGQTQSQPARTGWFRVQLPDLPAPAIKPYWFPYDLNPKQEVFELYIPPNPNNQPFGVFGWINPDDEAGTPRRFEPLLNEYHLVAISAERSGNDQIMWRRVGLIVSAVLQLSKDLPIDRSRILLSGLSGGGRMSATGCFVHPEFFRGAISWAGGNFYKTYSVPMPIGASSPGINDFVKNGVTDQNVKEAKKNCKFVLITGSKDFNLNDSRGIYRALRGENFQTMLIEQPGVGHEVGTVDSLKKALDFVLGSPSKN